MRFHLEKAVQGQTDFLIPRLTIREVIEGLRRVDNVLLMSLVWCPHCLVETWKKIYPYDVGMEEEAIAQPMQFLTTAVGTRGKDLLYRPWNVNIDFALMKSDRSKELRLGLYLNYVANRSALKLFLSRKIAGFRLLCREQAIISWDAEIELMCELLRLGCPPSEIEWALNTFAGLRKSALVVGLRTWTPSRRKVWPRYSRVSVPSHLLRRWRDHRRPIPPDPLTLHDCQASRLAACFFWLINFG